MGDGGSGRSIKVFATTDLPDVFRYTFRNHPVNAIFLLQKGRTCAAVHVRVTSIRIKITLRCFIGNNGGTSVDRNAAIAATEKAVLAAEKDRRSATKRPNFVLRTGQLQLQPISLIMNDAHSCAQPRIALTGIKQDGISSTPSNRREDEQSTRAFTSTSSSTVDSHRLITR